MTEGNFHQLVALLHCRGLHKVRPVPQILPGSPRHPCASLTCHRADLYRPATPVCPSVITFARSASPLSYAPSPPHPAATHLLPPPPLPQSSLSWSPGSFVNSGARQPGLLTSGSGATVC